MEDIEGNKTSGEIFFTLPYPTVSPSLQNWANASTTIIPNAMKTSVQIILWQATWIISSIIIGLLCIAFAFLLVRKKITGKNL